MSTRKLQCVVIDDDDISRQIVEKYIEKAEQLSLVSSYNNATDAINELSKADVDILFLDVEMPEVSGFDLMKSLTTNPYIILITSKSEYALDAFEHDVVDYLLKPVTYPRFLKAVNKIQELSTSTIAGTNSDDLFVKHNSRYIKIPASEILYIEAIGDYVEIYTQDRKHIAHTTMKALEKRLAKSNFLRVHRSYIIRLSGITEIEDNSVSINKKTIPIGKSYREELMNSLNLI